MDQITHRGQAFYIDYDHPDAKDGHIVYSMDRVILGSLYETGNIFQEDNNKNRDAFLEMAEMAFGRALIAHTN